MKNWELLITITIAVTSDFTYVSSFIICSVISVMTELMRKVEKKYNKAVYTAKDASSLVVLVKNGIFAWFQLVGDRRTDGHTLV